MSPFTWWLYLVFGGAVLMFVLRVYEAVTRWLDSFGDGARKDLAVLLIWACLAGIATGSVVGAKWLYGRYQQRDAKSPIHTGFSVIAIRPLKNDLEHTLGFLVDIKNFNTIQAFRITEPGVVTMVDVPGRTVKNPVNADYPIATIGPTQVITLRFIPNHVPEQDYKDLLAGTLRVNLGLTVFYTDDIEKFVLDYAAQPQLERGNEATVFRNSASRLKEPQPAPKQ